MQRIHWRHFWCQYKRYQVRIEVGSIVKQALKRRKPGFSESYYGFKSFSDLLEEAGKRKLLALERDEKSGGYIIRITTA